MSDIKASLRLVVCGAQGRMGSRVLELAGGDPRFHVVAGIERRPSAAPASSATIVAEEDSEGCLQRADVVLDFTTPEASVRFAQASARMRKPIVIGTTGFNPDQAGLLRQASKRTPVFLSPNFSLGMNLLFHLAERAAAALPRYDAGILEMHHTRKKDAPSGTALRLAESVRQARKDRLGSAGDVPIVSQRLGSVIGDHTLILAGGFERIELTHRAESRDAFALGALGAAIWVAKRRPGLYDMRRLLGL